MVSDILSTSGINQLIYNYKATEKNKLITPLTSKKQRYESLNTAWSGLKTKLSSLKTLLEDFKDSDLLESLGAKKATLSNDSFFTVTATDEAAESLYNIRVDQIAKNDIAVSQHMTSDDTIDANFVGDHSFEITSGSTTATINVTFDATDTNESALQKVVDAIQADEDASGIVNVSLFSPDDGESRLSFTAVNSGDGNAISFNDLGGTATQSALQMLDLDGARATATGSGGGYIYDTTELDAVLEFNGTQIRRDSNTISDLTTGLTFNLTAAMEGTDPTVTTKIETDIDSAKGEIQNFVDKFNEVYSYMRARYTSGSSSERGIFAGDSNAISVMNSLRTSLTNQVSGLGSGELQYLSQIGVSFDSATGLSISDADRLEDELTNNTEQVAALFNSTDGIAARLYDTVDNYTKTNGLISSLTSSYNSSIDYYTDRISSMQNRINASADVLRNQYERLQTQLASLLQNQANFVNFSNNFYSY